jgi:hypothetical protein
MTVHSAELGLKVCGEVEIDERLPPEGSNNYKSVQLLSVEDAEDIELEIGHCTDPDMRDDLGYFLGLKLYHQRNPETDRVFHTKIMVHPSRDELVMLRDFLEFLLKPAAILGWVDEQSSAQGAPILNNVIIT